MGRAAAPRSSARFILPLRLAATPSVRVASAYCHPWCHGFFCRIRSNAMVSAIPISHAVALRGHAEVMRRLASDGSGATVDYADVRSLWDHFNEAVPAT
jgi:hypothetical protein